jgi:hypothetical protein
MSFTLHECVLCMLTSVLMEVDICSLNRDPVQQILDMAENGRKEYSFNLYSRNVLKRRLQS